MHVPVLVTALAVQEAPTLSLYELIVAGGPLMIPIGLCSVVALAYATERWIRLRPGYLGTTAFGRAVVKTVRDEGVDPALKLCNKDSHPLARILAAGLKRAEEPFLDREKAVEDTAASEVRKLGSNLRPLLLVWLVSPLLGLLGTVWGMIDAFSGIATEAGMGRPEVLADGIYKALMTTAAGLSVAIPAIVLHHFLRGKLEVFAESSEAFYREIDEHMSVARAA